MTGKNWINKDLNNIDLIYKDLIEKVYILIEEIGFKNIGLDCNEKERIGNDRIGKD